MEAVASISIFQELDNQEKTKTMTKEEVQNVLVLIEAGARALAAQNPLDKGGNIMMTAHALAEKVAELAPKEPDLG